MSGSTVNAGRINAGRINVGRINVGRNERRISILAGAGLVLHALGRPSALSVLLGLGGVELVRRGVTGFCPAYDALGIDTEIRHAATPGFVYRTGKRGHARAYDHNDPSALSFPASDPPSHMSHSVGSPSVAEA